jgi:agmatinase
LGSALAIRKHESFFGLSNSNGQRDLVVVGLPWDSTSSYRRGAAAAPNHIRAATSARLYNRFTEQGLDLSDWWRVCDHGDVNARNALSLKQRLAARVGRHHHSDPSMLFMGGDHYVTLPCFTVAAAIQKRPTSLLYFDAHPDLYIDYEGKKQSHATVVSRILESDRSSGTVCYVGIRASTKEQDERIKRLRLETHTAHDVHTRGTAKTVASIRSVFADQPVYLSIDLDCLDPAFAPGVGNPQPGGLSTRQLTDILHGIRGLNIVAADIVEYSPKFDSPSKTTAFTAAILIKETMGSMIEPTPQNRD